MACACKVNQDISYLVKKYGHNIPVSKKMNVSFTIKNVVKDLFIYFLLLLAWPLMLIHVLFVLIFKKNKSIKVKNLIKLGKT